MATRPNTGKAVIDIKKGTSSVGNIILSNSFMSTAVALLATRFWMGPGAPVFQLALIFMLSQVAAGPLSIWLHSAFNRVDTLTRTDHV